MPKRKKAPVKSKLGTSAAAKAFANYRKSPPPKELAKQLASQVARSEAEGGEMHRPRKRKTVTRKKAPTKRKK